MSSVSSSWAPPPSWSWALVVCNCLSEQCWSGCRCGGGGRALFVRVVLVWLSLCWWRSWYWLFESAAVKSLSMKSHFEPSCAVVSQVVSFVTSLSSLRDLVDCGCKLMSSSHFLAGLPCFRYPFCLVEIAWLTVGDQFCPSVLRGAWQHPLLTKRKTANGTSMGPWAPRSTLDKLATFDHVLWHAAFWTDTFYITTSTTSAVSWKGSSLQSRAQVLVVFLRNFWIKKGNARAFSNEVHG